MKKIFIFCFAVILSQSMLNAKSFLDMTPEELREATTRAGKIAGVKAGCKTQAQIACYTDNVNFCKKTGGINQWYNICLNNSTLDNVASKKTVMKHLSK